jgi:hypothetical protein
LTNLVAVGDLPLDVATVRQHDRVFLLKRFKELSQKRDVPRLVTDFRDALDFQTATVRLPEKDANLFLDIGGEGRVYGSDATAETLAAFRARFYGEIGAFAFATDILEGGVSRGYQYAPGENPAGGRTPSFFPRLVTRHTGYVAAGTERLNAQVGRLDVVWGTGRSGTLTLSDNTDPKDGVRFGTRLGRFRFESLTATAPHADNESYISAHRLSVSPRSNIVLSTYEGVLYKDRLELAYLNPVTVYLLTVPAVERATGLDSNDAYSGDNLFFGGDILWRPVRGWLLYADGMIDDLQANDDAGVLRNWDTKFATQVGTYIYRPELLSGSDLRAEYTVTNQYVYTHEAPGLNYTLAGRPLGYRTGPDADSLWIEASTLVKPRWRAGASLRLTRKGETNIEDVHQPDDPARWTFLSGVVETTYESSLFVSFTHFGTASAYGRGFIRTVRNAGHRDGTTDSDAGFELRVQATL